MQGSSGCSTDSLRTMTTLRQERQKSSLNEGAQQLSGREQQQTVLAASDASRMRMLPFQKLFSSICAPPHPNGTHFLPCTMLAVQSCRRTTAPCRRPPPATSSDSCEFSRHGWL